jgi:uroporphyrinogen-III synthase
VLVTRASDQADELLAALRSVGLEPVLVPAIEIESMADPTDLDLAASRLPTYRWIVVTSTNGVRELLDAADRGGLDPGVPAWAAIGEATRSALQLRGVEAAFTPSRPSAAALADELPVSAGDRVLVAHGDLAGDALARALTIRGALVDDVIAYRTTEAPIRSRGSLRAAVDAGPIAAVLFTSGSTVRGMHALAAAEGVDLVDLPAVCIGEATATIARSVGFRVVTVAPSADAVTLARTAAAALATGAGDTA